MQGLSEPISSDAKRCPQCGAKKPFDGWDALATFFKVILCSFLVYAIVSVFAKFGTLSPCGMLRESVRQHDTLAAALPDNLVDAALEAQYGALSPARCVNLLLRANNNSPPHSIAERSQAIDQEIEDLNNFFPARQQTSQTQSPAVTPAQMHAERMKQAGKETNAAMQECRTKRLNGELKKLCRICKNVPIQKS